MRVCSFAFAMLDLLRLVLRYIIPLTWFLCRASAINQDCLIVKDMQITGNYLNDQVEAHCF